MALGVEGEELARFDLNSDSVVVIVGAYVGHTAAELHRLFQPQIYAYEPVETARHKFTQRLGHAKNIRLFPYGLGVLSGTFPMEKAGCFGGSFLGQSLGHFSPSSQLVKGRLVEVQEAFRSEGIENIDLLHMNIEGYEYYLLPYMGQHGLLARCRYLMLQFHLVFEESGYPEPAPVQPPHSMQYRQIRDQLAETHELRWDKGAPWSSWERR